MVQNNTSFLNADELFTAAKEEFMRPEEDIVPYAVCHKCYYSVIDYLKGYLKNNDIDSKGVNDISGLLELCKRADARFSELNLSRMSLNDDSDAIWINVKKAQEFMDLTTRTRLLVGLN